MVKIVIAMRLVSFDAENACTIFKIAKCFRAVAYGFEVNEV